MFSRNSRNGALSAHISGDHDHVPKYRSYYQKDKVGWIGRKVSFGTLHRRLAVELHKTFPSPIAKWVFSNDRHPVLLYMDSYSTNMLVN